MDRHLQCGWQADHPRWAYRSYRRCSRGTEYRLCRFFEGASLKIIGGEFYSSNADAVGGEYSDISVVGGSFFPEVPTKGIVKSAVFTDEIINGTTYKVISYTSEGGTYKIANPAVQIAMLEPWGVRVSAAVTKDGAAISPDDYATENIRCGVWFAIGDEKYTSVEEIKNAVGSQYISGKADTDGFLCDYRGIYIYDFGKYISMTIELDTEMINFIQRRYRIRCLNLSSCALVRTIVSARRKIC